MRAGGLTARRVPRLPSRTLSLRKIDGGEDGERLGGGGGRKGSSDERGVAIFVRRPAENECDKGHHPPTLTDRPVRWGDRE